MTRLTLLSLMFAGCASHLPHAQAPGALSEADLPPGDVLERDVDLDGWPDAVYSFPRVVVDRIETRLEDLPPAIVARGLPDGRFTFDDPVSRAALRALCPEPPPVRAWSMPEEESDPYNLDTMRTGLLETLLIDAYCLRVWGASIEEAVDHVRASIAQSDPPPFPGDVGDALASALSKLFVPHKLAPLAPPPFPHWPAARAHTGLDRTSATSPRCAPVRSRWQEVQRQMQALVPPDNNSVLTPLTLAEPLCMDAGSGLWALTPGAFRVTSEDGWSTGYLEATLTWLPHIGTTASVPMRSEWQFDNFSTHDAKIAAVFDLDHDGVPEVFVQHSNWNHEAPDTSRITIHSARDGRITEYPHTPEAPLAVADIDGDGRPDLLLQSPWGFVDRCGHAGIDHSGPSAAAHALPNGRFAFDDKATRAWLRSQCVAPEEGALPDVLEIACARLAGLDPEAIVAALHMVHPTGPQRLLDENHLEDDRCFTFQELAAQSLIGVGLAPQ
jgi:hypothetical protein